MTKVLLFHNIPSPYRLPLFEELGKEVELEVCFLESKMEGRLWENHLDNYKFNYSFSNGKKIGSMLINLDIVKKLRKGNYDVIIFVDDLPAILNSYIISFFSKLYRKKIVIWNGRFHSGIFTENAFKKKLSKFLLNIHTKLLYSFADSVITYGVKAKKYLNELGMNNKKIVSGTQTYPKSLIDFSTSKVAKKDKRIITTISYLNTRKGIDILIKAFMNSSVYDNSILYIVGDGNERAKLESIANKSKNIIFTGNLDGKEKYKLLNNSDIFVLPTLYDSWGLVINEAMEFNLPIITTNMAMASHELIKDNGIMVTSGSEKEFINAIEQIYKMDLDILGSASKELIQKYDVNFVIGNFKTAISLALNN